MPFKSQSQRRFFYAAADRGDIAKKTVRHWEKETKSPLPERKTMNKSAAFDAGVLAAMEKEALSLPFSASAALARKGAEMGLKGAKPMGIIGGSAQKLKRRVAGMAPTLGGHRGMGMGYATA